MKYSSSDTQLEIIFLSFWAISRTTQKTKKMKKAPGDVIILNLCNKKHDHMMYASSDMECD